MAASNNEDARYSKRPLCPHSNILEECAQCDSDFQQEVDSTILDQAPEEFVVFFPNTLEN